MALRSGQAGQVGFVDEVTPGTAVTVTRFLPLVDESMTQQIDRMVAKGIIPGRRTLLTGRRIPGNKTIDGSVGLEMQNKSIGLLWKHMFGASATTGSGPYQHTFSAGDLSGLSFTMQIGRPGTAGTVHPFTFAGCKVTEWELGLTQGEVVTLGLDISAMSVVTGTALASASLASGVAPYTFQHAAITVGGSAVDVIGGTLKGSNMLATDRRFLGTATIAEQFEAGIRDYSGELDLEFKDLTQYARFVAGTEHALVVTLTNGTDTLTITTNVMLDGEDPHVEGPELLAQAVPFTCVGSTTDASAITAVLVNGDSTP